jgi:putative transposase
MSESPHPERSHPAHHPLLSRERRPIIIMLTVCTMNRKPILVGEDVHELLKQMWKSPHAKWRVGRYVIMPDHVHLFCAPATNPPEPLAPWVRWWKASASKVWPRAAEHPIWQRDFWDRQLRSGDNYGERWEYVRQNPVRAGLVTTPEAWQYQGEIDILFWQGR